MQRRDFVSFCAGGAALAVAPDALLAANSEPRFYAKARLTDATGAPLKAKLLKVNHNYIFNYPYAGTPCFLLRLDKPAGAEVALTTEAGKTYLWPGGVGDTRSIVAYSAICSHRLAYPTKDLSFISFRSQKSALVRKPNIIHCCAEHSEYDPAAGARVINGPAPQPLATILLEYDQSTDELIAVGTYGGELFNEFFKKYDFKLALDHGGQNRAQKATVDRVVVDEMTSYCKQNIQC